MSTSTNELNSKLCDAVKDGDNDALLIAIAKGADVNWKNEDDVSKMIYKQLLTIIMISTSICNTFV